jgi:hypothetical protein
MINFEGLFRESKGKPIQYKGKELRLFDTIKLEKGENSFKLVFEKAESEWKQGVMLSCKGFFEINGQKVKKSIVLWQATAPREVEFFVQSDSDEMQIKNVWDISDGAMHSWHAGAAMYMEKTSSGNRYFCNDGHLDDNCTDLVFALDKIQ